MTYSDHLARRGRFSSVITGDDVTRGKPDPQVFLLAAAGLKLPAGRCAVVEDAPAGIAAAKAAGALAIGLVSTGTRGRVLARPIIACRRCAI